MVKDIRKSESAKFLNQADEFMQSADDNMDAGRYNAATFSAVQAMINANDAFTVFFLEKRASADHRECLKLHTDAAGIIQDTSQKKRLKDGVNLRSQAGYTGEWVSKSEAEKALRHAAQFLAWVKKKIS